MSANIVKINKYLDKLQEFINKIDIVHDCQLYNKQIDFQTRKVNGVPLFDGKATCFVEHLGSLVDQSATQGVRRLIQNYTINVYVIAKNTRSANPNARIGSQVCNDAIDEIQSLLFEDDLDLNIELPKMVSSNLVDDGSQVYVEYSIHYLQFTQRLTTHEQRIKK